MRLGKYIKDRLYSVCIFVAMLIISVLMMAAFKVSVQLIIAEIFIMIICYIAVVLADYYHRKKFYDELEHLKKNILLQRHLSDRLSMKVRFSMIL